MIVKGNRRGGAGQLAAHLLRHDTNETVIIREIEGYPQKHFVDQDLKAALSFMAAQGQANGKSRTLYHSVIAPQEGEILNRKQIKQAVDTLAKNLGMEGHHRVIVEHHKDGRQHFHVVFNILHPETGKQARLQWTRKKEWATGRQLEQELGLKPVISKGRAAKQWEEQRGNRTGIDPHGMRKEVTAIYHASATGREFIANLDKAGYVLTRGNKDQYVLVDKAGDIHGLLRRIEGVKLKDLKQKFPDLKEIPLPSLASIQKERQATFAASHKKTTDKSGREKGRVEGSKGGKGGRGGGRSAKPFTTGTIEPEVFRKSYTVKPPQRIFAAMPPIPSAVRPSAPHRPNTRNITQAFRAASTFMFRDRRGTPRPNQPEKFFNPDAGPMTTGELIAWAFANGRYDILSMFGIFVDFTP